MISCADAVRQLWDYIENSVTPEERENLDEHLSFCLRCCGAADFARELSTFLAGQAADEVPTHVRTRMEQILEEL